MGLEESVTGMGAAPSCAALAAEVQKHLNVYGNTTDCTIRTAAQSAIKSSLNKFLKCTGQPKITELRSLLPAVGPCKTYMLPGAAQAAYQRAQYNAEQAQMVQQQAGQAGQVAQQAFVQGVQQGNVKSATAAQNAIQDILQTSQSAYAAAQAQAHAPLFLSPGGTKLSPSVTGEVGSEGAEVAEAGDGGDGGGD